MRARRLTAVFIFFIAVLAGCNATETVPPPTSPGGTTASTNPTTTQITTNPSGTISDMTIVINEVVYKGDPAKAESDEYVEIQNWMRDPVDMTGWTLTNLDRDIPTFTFPAYTLADTEIIRVYTNEVYPQWGGFSFGSDKPLWDNVEGDTAILYDAGGQEISRRTY
jgi:hypothetical protein